MGWWEEEQQRRFLVQVVHSGEHSSLKLASAGSVTLQWTGYYHFGNLGFSVLG